MELFNPHSADWLLNKFKIYTDLRNRDAAYWSERYQMYVITRYDDVFHVLNNPDVFSSAQGNLIVENSNRFGLTLGASDNPVHNVYKNIVKKAYNKDNLQRINDCFINQATQLLSNKSTINVSEIIEELSAWTTAEILNLPYDKTKIKDLVFDIQRHSSPAVSENINDASYTKLVNIIWTLTTLSKTASTGPGIYHEFMSNNPDNLNTISLFTGPAISGASSLTSALQSLTLDLFRENQLGLLINDRKLIPSAVNESLRLHASTGRFSRTVTQDITLHNVKLLPGTRVAVCLDSANRDPLVFEDPDKFIITRNTSKHLGFGYGVHACIALAISKMLMTSWIEILLDNVGLYKVTTNDFKYVMTASGNNDMISNLVIDKEHYE
jgi:cytochrome P450